MSRADATGISARVAAQPFDAKEQDRATLRLIRDLAMLHARAETYALPGSGSDSVLAFELEWIAEDLENLAGAARAISDRYTQRHRRVISDGERAARVIFSDRPRPSDPSLDPVGSGSEER